MKRSINPSDAWNFIDASMKTFLGLFILLGAVSIGWAFYSDWRDALFKLIFFMAAVGIIFIVSATSVALFRGIKYLYNKWRWWTC